MVRSVVARRRDVPRALRIIDPHCSAMYIRRHSLRPSFPSHFHDEPHFMPTSLPHHSLYIHIAKFDAPSHHSHSKFFVDGRPVRVADLTPSNGVIHVLDRVLDPRGPLCLLLAADAVDARANADWENWKGWFPQWASQAA
ncbi:hypothetical protein C8R44DRAFT_815562 [Mycena epipterygia]|nr:hypothetical protein C8R44DRAFT_815562 [Mycena epipterygia]